jgi:hypothetical protein
MENANGVPVVVGTPAANQNAACEARDVICSCRLHRRLAERRVQDDACRRDRPV